MPTPDFTLYLATDRALLAGRAWDEVIAAALSGGVTMLQLRDKQASARELFETGQRLLPLARRYGVPLLINDRLDVALALGADGVHLGRGDLPLAAARRLAPGLILGYSVNRPEHLEHAEACGADYVGVGPVFATATKGDTAPVLGLEGLRRLVARAHIPCVGIGGITLERAPAVRAAGAAGVCVISAVLGEADVAAAARQLRAALAAAD
jgi:thiamine-phosphate pyrophosphorylase